VPRVVLDSNVWIDILVFDDPAIRPIRHALAAGTLVAIIDARCLDELCRVLDYPQFARYRVDKAGALDHVACVTTMFPAQTAPVADHPPATGPIRTLPLCRDRDDQKFLELSHAAGVDWLVTKDRALLKMARRIARDFGFRIAEPGPFVQAWDTLPCASPALDASPAARARPTSSTQTARASPPAPLQ
jgi:uncharacterized protein